MANYVISIFKAKSKEEEIPTRNKLWLQFMNKTPQEWLKELAEDSRKVNLAMPLGRLSNIMKNIRS